VRFYNDDAGPKLTADEIIRVTAVAGAAREQVILPRMTVGQLLRAIRAKTRLDSTHNAAERGGLPSHARPKPRQRTHNHAQSDAPLSQKEFNVSQAEAEHMIQPDGMADDRGGKAVAVVRAGWRVHAASLARERERGIERAVELAQIAATRAFGQRGSSPGQHHGPCHCGRKIDCHGNTASHQCDGDDDRAQGEGQQPAYSIAYPALRGDYSQPKCIDTLKAAITASETALTEEITRTDVRSFMRGLLRLRAARIHGGKMGIFPYRYVISLIRNGKAITSEWL
jgi:hypothetical protein